MQVYHGLARYTQQDISSYSPCGDKVGRPPNPCLPEPSTIIGSMCNMSYIQMLADFRNTISVSLGIRSCVCQVTTCQRPGSQCGTPFGRTTLLAHGAPMRTLYRMACGTDTMCNLVCLCASPSCELHFFTTSPHRQDQTTSLSVM